MIIKLVNSKPIKYRIIRKVGIIMCSKEKLLKETTELINSIAEKFVAPKIYKQVLNQLNRFIIYKLRTIFTLMPANKDEDRFDNAYAKP